MLKLIKPAEGEPAIDLETVRVTIAYIQSDLANAPGLKKASDALAIAIKEIEIAEAAVGSVARPRLASSRFVSRRD